LLTISASTIGVVSKVFLDSSKKLISVHVNRFLLQLNHPREVDMSSPMAAIRINQLLALGEGRLFGLVPRCITLHRAHIMLSQSVVSGLSVMTYVRLALGINLEWSSAARSWLRWRRFKEVFGEGNRKFA
jgi:hypothetical protein